MGGSFPGAPDHRESACGMIKGPARAERGGRRTHMMGSNHMTRSSAWSRRPSRCPYFAPGLSSKSSPPVTAENRSSTGACIPIARPFADPNKSTSDLRT